MRTGRPPGPVIDRPERVTSGTIHVADRRGEHVDRARQRLREFVENLIAEAAQDGDLRDDVAAGELAGYCLHALTAAGTVDSHDAVHRLVAVTLTGLGTPAPPP
ncbi:hypothetical protein AB0B54_09880 [Microbispora bryophytorum]|uniref:SbtR family transcriptional regulator n=1 Tax=Microbispora bryophytorum TaxID=1460882 RepID=UPI0033FE9EEE